MNNQEVLIKFDWKAIAIGLVISIIGFAISILLARYLGSLSSLSGFIFITAAGAVAGYKAKGHIMNGAIHGGIVGLLLYLIVIAYLLLRSGNPSMFSYVIMGLLTILIGYISLGIIGGAIGGIILMIMNRKPPAEEEDETPSKPVPETEEAPELTEDSENKK